MLVMPANNQSGVVHYWAGRVPGKVGLLWSPDPKLKRQKLSYYEYFPYALDNYRFVSCSKGIAWDSEMFFELLGYARHLPKPPLFVVVPDIWGDATATIEEWYQWEPRLRKYSFPLAFCVQDGLKFEDVPSSADWLFVGGSDEWRYPRLKQIVGLGKPVHVGRVNHRRHLWNCHDCSVASCDGTGWFRGDKKQLQVLLDYWAYLAGDIARPGSEQIELNLELEAA